MKHFIPFSIPTRTKSREKKRHLHGYIRITMLHSIAMNDVSGINMFLVDVSAKIKTTPKCTALYQSRDIFHQTAKMISLANRPS